MDRLPERQDEINAIAIRHENIGNNEIDRRCSFDDSKRFDTALSDLDGKASR